MSKIDRIIRNIERHPGQSTPAERTILTKAALRMPSNLRVRLEASAIVYWVRSQIAPDEEARTTNVELKFEAAQEALRAIEKIAAHNSRAIDPTKIRAATQREEEILAIRPTRLTQWAHRKLPWLKTPQYAIRLGQCDY